MKLTEIIDNEYKDIKEEKVLQQKKEYKTDLLHTYINLFLHRSSKSTWWSPETYTRASECVTTHLIETISSEDISQFSLELSKYEKHHLFNETGYFLSAIINQHNKKNSGAKYTLLLKDLQKKVNGICCQNEADVTIIGDCDEYFCYGMQKGTVLLNGSCGDSSCLYIENGNIHIKGNVYGSFAHTINGGHIHIEGSCKKNSFENKDDTISFVSSIGSHMHNGIIEIDGDCEYSIGTAMSGGKIIVKGNVKEEAKKGIVEGVGRNMHGGEIQVHGNAGENIGAEMCSGKIYLHGTYKNISEKFIAGKIYHKDVLIQSRWKKNIKKIKYFFGIKKEENR